jgi:hypothetical protein
MATAPSEAFKGYLHTLGFRPEQKALDGRIAELSQGDPLLLGQVCALYSLELAYRYGEVGCNDYERFGADLDNRIGQRRLELLLIDP